MQAWQATVQDDRGNAVPNPVLTVYEADGITEASIFNQDGTALPNPLTGSIDGFVQFWAHPGRYKIEGASGGGRTEVWDWSSDYRIVTPQDFGAVGDFNYITKMGTDDTEAFRAALATGRRVFIPKADYRITGELEVTTPGQVIEFETSGGYAYGEDIGANWGNGGTRLVATGTFAKRIRTRRLWRGGAGDPQDAPLSVVLNVQAEGVQIIRPSIALWCDYSNASPTNLGDNCDVGIFIGCRVGVQIHDPQVIGYFRQRGIMLDVTGGAGLPRFPSLAGTAYPDGTPGNGADGFHLWNPYIRGPRIGFSVLGAAPRPGQTTYQADYYDQILGATVPDRRGSFGASDMEVFGGRIYGPDHHSNRRLKDPVLVGGVLTQAGMETEPDDAPAAVHIDGLAGNSSNSIWGMRFIGTRIATFEAFRVRLGRASRVSFYGAHIEGRGSSSRMTTTGTPVDSNDYATASYGDIAGGSQASSVTVFASARNDYASLAPHFYNGKPYLLSDSGNALMGGGYLSFLNEGDYRSSTGHRFRRGAVSIATLTDLAFELYGQYIFQRTGVLDLRGEGGVLLRQGNVSKVTVSTEEVRFHDAQIRMGTSTGPITKKGTGSPEGVLIAPRGSDWTDTSTGNLWIKSTTSGNTGWRQVAFV